MLNFFVCPRKEKLNSVTNLRIPIASCKSNQTEVGEKRSMASPSPVTASKKSSKDYSNDESEMRTTQKNPQSPWPNVLGPRLN